MKKHFKPGSLGDILNRIYPDPDGRLRALRKYVEREDVSEGARKRALRAIKAEQHHLGIHPE